MSTVTTTRTTTTEYDEAGRPIKEVIVTVEERDEDDAA